VLRAIEVTILVFTVKFQTGGGRRGLTGVLTRKREERERERGEEGCARAGNINGTSDQCFGAKTPAEQREVDGDGQAERRGAVRGRGFR